MILTNTVIASLDQDVSIRLKKTLHLAINLIPFKNHFSLNYKSMYTHTLLIIDVKHVDLKNKNVKKRWIKNVVDKLIKPNEKF